MSLKNVDENDSFERQFILAKKHKKLKPIFFFKSNHPLLFSFLTLVLLFPRHVIHFLSRQDLFRYISIHYEMYL